MAHSSTILRSEAEVRKDFESRGVSISAWARLHGYSAQLVYGVLAGRKRCLRGQSHEIAVRLGLKAGQIGTAADIGVAVGSGAGVGAEKTTGPEKENHL